jgi:hypothetical protein
MRMNRTAATWWADGGVREFELMATGGSVNHQTLHNVADAVFEPTDEDEAGYTRSVVGLPDGTQLLTAKDGEQVVFAVAWHPFRSELAKAAVQGLGG